MIVALDAKAYACTPDFELDWLPNIWRNPETGVTILGEWMPWELMPVSDPQRRNGE